MTTTAPKTLRKSDVSRMVGRILGKDKRSAARGWDVIDTGSEILVTLNHFSDDDDRAAYDKLTAAYGARYTLHYTADLGDYSWLDDDYNYCAVVSLHPLEKESPVPADTHTVNVPLPVAAFWDAHTEDLHTERDAATRDAVAAYRTGTTAPHGRGAVYRFTTTPTIARIFLALLASYTDTEFDSDNADTKGATAALRFLAREEAKGLTPHIPDGYRMINDADQATLEADIRAAQERTATAAARTADNDTHRAAWKSLTPAERTTRTHTLLNAACAVFGLQRADTRSWFALSGVNFTSPDGRLYAEVARLTDTTAPATLDTARTALEAAGWTVTAHDGSFYATPADDAPQDAQGPQEAATAPAFTDWERDLLAAADTLPDTASLAAARLLEGLTVDHGRRVVTVGGHDVLPDGTVTLTLAHPGGATYTAPLDEVAVTDADHDTFARRVKGYSAA
ncbi:hypothetical protein QFZ75_008022 [Streptomyces sp. V3I8]|uniref:hypothetical protein n=1 Tax=Streptomyces sp. V3I8 TaxID=3042279 RepID=UPI0027850576|nr:hypothetical protein [Streptomyces sp. V3I8]MDQ1041520.1 hypothetical protein [Streptomyces sp. V3I8]